ncbi:MAG: choice-of-anchor D domain-containing protein, partial [Myxococcales bacterium]|nr:choice-of-anchor D domain-containing protein [Myxococcales bacterium]
MSRPIAPRRLDVALLTVALTLVAACGDGTAPGDDTPVTCVTDDECAAGFSCVGGLCAMPVDGGADATALPDLVVTPPSLDFGSPAIGARLELTLTLRNIGGGPLHISRLEVVESDALPEYSAQPSGDIDLELPAGGETSVLVTLAPGDAEADLGELRVHSSDPDAPLIAVPLRSEVKGAPALSVTPADVDFGVVDWGTTRTAEVDVKNTGTGNAPLELRTATLTDTSGSGSVYSVALVLVDPVTSVESPATLPLYLAPGTNAAFLRARVAVDTTPLGGGELPAESLVFTTDRTAPTDAERRVSLAGTVLGCATPTAETCNGVDDDCDLTVDDGAPGGGAACVTGLLGECAVGTTACVAGAISCVPNVTPSPETCDGIDSNCDGVVDGGLVQTCTRGCGDGIEFCVTGIWTGCNAPAPAAEVCNGVDDDCNPATADGAADPSLGSACDGADSDLCLEGSRACAAGTLLCIEAAGDARDLCNGLDDDCNGATTDGSAEPTIGSGCDGADSDLCVEGVVVCTVGALGCTDGGPDLMDVCNGINDDCDAASADGTEDPLLGTLCDGADSDLCAEGTRACTFGLIACSDATGGTDDVCNGLDDDCDAGSPDGNEDPGVGTTCDGADSDLCLEGSRICSFGSIVCGDATGSINDVCNGLDDDCDPASADGAEDALNGAACDGTDTDLCIEGTRSCALGALVCSDTTGSTTDLCGAGDEDCDAGSPDGSEDPGVGTACDGADSDLCIEGSRICSFGSIVCSDATGGTDDVCNGSDDDCDAGSPDGSEDPGVGAPCDGADSDLCIEGSRFCSGGSLGCNDFTSGTVEICGNTVDEDCTGGAAACSGPTNDFPSGAINISAGGTFTADLISAADD